MERRTFLAGIPVAAAGLAMAKGASAQPAQEESGALPSFAAADAESYDRPDVGPGDRPVGVSFGSRSEVFGLNGAVGTAHPLATLAGLDILRRGGSAVDAAIAVNACLGLMEPTGCGIGGDAYALMWDPKTAKVVGIAGSGRSPRSLSIETVRGRLRNGIIPAYGAVPVSVPGAVDMWWTMHQRHGKMKWADLFAPAISHATNGFPVTPVVAFYMKRAMANFLKPGAGIEETDNARRTFAPNGETPGVGEIFRNPDLARTYRAIARGGRDAFYEGEIAQTIDAYFRRIGGWLSRDDLAGHRSEWVEPLSTQYRGVTVHAIGANTQGAATLAMLNILDTFDMRGAGFMSPRSIHLQAEAKRLAYEDRARYYADPAMADVPFDWIVSKQYAAERAKLIRFDRVNDRVRPGQAPAQGDTTYFTVADADGMMVSFIQSNFRGMGSGLVADGLGFMFQDRGQLFSLQPGHPNLYAPGKRPFQTIIPGFATRDGQPWLSFGVMGGDMQPQGQTQIIVNRVDYGLDAQGAGDAPRWHHEGSSQSMGEDSPGLGPRGQLNLERGVPDRTAAALASLGWKIGENPGGFGRYQCIERRMDGDTRVWGASSEMRTDGLALAY